MKAHRRELFACCLSVMDGNRADAEDAFSAASQRLMKHYAGIRLKLRNPKAWFLRVTWSTCISLLRERRRHGAWRPLDPEDGAERDLASIASSAGDQEQDHATRELYRRVLHLIEALPEALRGPLEMRGLHELDYGEISRRLDLTEENVRKRVQQARALLRQQLRDAGHDWEGGERRGPASRRVHAASSDRGAKRPCPLSATAKAS